ncbi:MAG TPA: hypothetical protein VKC54_04685 [Patescibacteria group bacterium]|nr:hypothetical protein [Patescibacteria group bacterium]
MGIEINLGERFGKIKIEREKSIYAILTDLSKDQKAIDTAIERYCLEDIPGYKARRGDLPLRLTIVRFEDKTATARLAGYNVIRYDLSVDMFGNYYQEIQKRPTKSKINIQGLGMLNLDDESATVNPKYLPGWITTNISPKVLQEFVNDTFYPKKQLF